MSDAFSRTAVAIILLTKLTTGDESAVTDPFSKSMERSLHFLLSPFETSCSFFFICTSNESIAASRSLRTAIA